MVSPQISGLSQDERRTAIQLAKRLDEIQAELDALAVTVQDHEDRITVLEP